MKKSWVYILLCSDNTYYTGCTTNLDERIDQHNTGFFKGYTSEIRPVTLIWYNEFDSLEEAIKAERMIKGWSRKKKEAMMNGRFDLVKELAQSPEIRQRRDKKMY